MSFYSKEITAQQELVILIRSLSTNVLHMFQGSACTFFVLDVIFKPKLVCCYFAAQDAYMPVYLHSMLKYVI